MKTFVKKWLFFLLFGIPFGSLFLSPCVFIFPYETGDLGRITGIPFGLYDTLFHPVKYCFTENIGSFDSLQNAEIVTIGDSFSQNSIMGYQNYLGHSLNKTISNFRIDNACPESTALTLLSNNMIPKCKVLIVESAAKYAVKSLCDNFCILDDVLQKQVITKQDRNLLNGFKPKDIEIKPFIIDFKKLIAFYKSKISFVKAYRHLLLSDSLFTAAKFSKSLFFYNLTGGGDGDLNFRHLTEEQFSKARANLNNLIDTAQKHNIQLIYLVPANKYDMYYDFVIDNPYPRDPTFDHFADFDTSIFVNTKKLLLPYLQKGVKDVYRVNDTHWSIVASEIVGNYLADIIRKKDYLE